MELQRKLRELVRFGYDVFISYSRSDGLRYAQTLYVALNERGLAPFIDVVGTSPGQSTPTLVLRRLRRSSMLVLVCSTGAAASKNIGEEIAVFTPTGRNIVVIDIEGALVGAGFKAHLGGLPVHAETALRMSLFERRKNVAARSLSGATAASANSLRKSPSKKSGKSCA